MWCPKAAQFQGIPNSVCYANLAPRGIIHDAWSQTSRATAVEHSLLEPERTGTCSQTTLGWEWAGEAPAQLAVGHQVPVTQTPGGLPPISQAPREITHPHIQGQAEHPLPPGS